MAKSNIKQKLAQKKTRTFSPKLKRSTGNGSTVGGVKLKRKGCCGKV